MSVGGRIYLPSTFYTIMFDEMTCKITSVKMYYLVISFSEILSSLNIRGKQVLYISKWSFICFYTSLLYIILY